MNTDCLMSLRREECHSIHWSRLPSPPMNKPQHICEYDVMRGQTPWRVFVCFVWSDPFRTYTHKEQ